MRRREAGGAWEARSAWKRGRGGSARAVLLLLPLLLGGCAFLSGFMHMRPVEVTGWSPHREFIGADEVQSVAVSFSATMSRPLAEEAFSLTRDSAPLSGRFAWRDGDRTLTFSPDLPLSDGHRYRLAVDGSAEDLYGNSLAEPFSFPFLTGRERLPPAVLSHSPEDGGEVSDGREPVVIRFSEPVDAGSFYRGFSLAPAVPGVFFWSDGGREVRFQPTEDYASGRVCTVTVSTEVHDPSGNRLAEPFLFSFSPPGEQEVRVLSVRLEPSDVLLLPLSQGGFLDPGLEVEKDEWLAVSFSDPVPVQRHDALIAVEPPAAFTVSWQADLSACTVVFDEYLRWNDVYTVVILQDSYSFLVNGPASVPVSVTGVSYCPDLSAAPSADKFVPLEYAANYDFIGAVEPAFDFHLRHAVGQSIDLGSFLEALDISVGQGCVALAALEVRVSPLAVDPDPLPGPGETVVRLVCTLSDDPGRSGTVTFRLDTALADSAGNRLQQEYRLLVNN